MELITVNGWRAGGMGGKDGEMNVQSMGGDGKRLLSKLSLNFP